MSTSTDTAAPAAFLPEIVTDIHADGTAAMSIGGQPVTVSTLPRPDDTPRDVQDRISAKCRERWIAHARAEQREIAVFVRDPQGEWRIIVRPDGEIVDPPGPVVDALPVPPVDPAPGTASGRRRRVLSPVPTERGGGKAVPDRLRPQAPPPADLADLPTMDGLRAKRTQPRSAPADRGWQGAVRRGTFGLLSPAPGEREMHLRSCRRSVSRNLDGSKTIVVANGQGGAPKTSTAVSLATVIAAERGGDIVLWDNNPNMGNLAARAGAVDPGQRNTVIQLLRDFDTIDSRARLNNYLRTVENQYFLVLASNEDEDHQRAVTGDEFAKIHRMLAERFSVIVVDTGNDVTACGFRAAVDAADQMVVPMSLGQKSIEGAMQMMARLRSWDRVDLARAAVGIQVLGNTGPNAAALRLTRREAADLRARAREQFAPPNGWMRALREIPLDPALAFDRPVEYELLSRASGDAWLEATAAVFDGL